MINKLIMTLLLLIIVGCAPVSLPVDQSGNSQQVVQTTTSVVPACDLKPIKVPVMPDEVPAYTHLDEATGLHMTGKPQEIDFSSYRLEVNGLVEQPLSLRYDDLRCLPKVTDDPLLVCRGFFEDKANWSGVPIAEILDLAHPLPDAKGISLVSADGYKQFVDMQTAMNRENFLAYEWEGQPLPVLHGFPLRAVFPKREGNFWIKWIVAIQVN